MQKTLVLILNEDGFYVPFVLQGFTSEEKRRLEGRPLDIPRDLSEGPVIVNGTDSRSRFADLRGMLNLPYFTSAPILFKQQTVALLITGRMAEQPPFLTPLGVYDCETVCSIVGLLSSAVMSSQLREVTRRAETDVLTGLLNRGAFKTAADEYIGGGREHQGAFMMIDVDYFKHVNDSFGHLAGDEVLKACASAIKQTLRETDIVGRQGGDEFVVFCKGIDSVSMAEKKAAQIAKAWRAVIPPGGVKPITASIGIAMYPDNGADFHSLFSRADAALYEAKEQGRDKYVVFSGVN